MAKRKLAAVPQQKAEQSLPFILVFDHELDKLEFIARAISGVYEMMNQVDGDVSACSIAAALDMSRYELSCLQETLSIRLKQKQEAA